MCSVELLLSLLSTELVMLVKTSVTKGLVLFNSLLISSKLQLVDDKSDDFLISWCIKSLTTMFAFFSVAPTSGFFRLRLISIQGL